MPRKKRHKEPLPRCGRPTLRGKGPPCKNAAGKKTSHLGQGPCHKHKGHDGQPTTYEHAKYTPRWLKDRISNFLKDPDLLSISHIIARQRAMLDVLEERAKTPDALGPEQIELIQKVSDSLSKNIERQHNIEIKREYLVKIEQVNVIVNEFVTIIGDIAQTEDQRKLAIRRLEVAAALKGGNGGY